MEKKRINISIIVLILILTVGFATVTTSLIITGSTKISKSDFSVYFSSATTDSGGSVEISSDKKGIIYNTKTLLNVGDTATLNYTVYNNSANYDADVSVLFYMYDDHSYVYNSDYYTITRTTFDTSSSTTVPAKTGVNGTIVITLTKPVTTDIIFYFGMELTANAIERSAIGVDNTLNGISTTNELIAAFANGGRYKLTNDLDISGLGELPVTSDLVLDFNGYTITSDINQINVTTGDLTLQATYGGGISAERGCVNVSGGKLTIDGGYYSTTEDTRGAVVYVNGGDLIVNNGFLDGAANAIGTQSFDNIYINGGHLKSSNGPTSYAIALNRGNNFEMNGGWVDGTRGGIWIGNGTTGHIYGGFVTVHDKYVDGVKQNYSFYAIYMYNANLTIDGGYFYSEEIVDSQNNHRGVINIYNDYGILNIESGTFSSNTRLESYDLYEYSEPYYFPEYNATFYYDKGGPC